MGDEHEGFSAALRAAVAPGSCRPPGLRRESVPRDALMKPLLDVGPEELVVVTAPAGYGKTTTLALWEQADDRPCAWVHLGRLDNDPVHLLRHAALSVDRVKPLDEEVVRTLTGPGSRPDIDMVPAIVGAIERCGPTILVLDDVHALSSADALTTIGRLIEERPPQCLVVLAGRASPPVARYRMDAGVVEISTDDLAMTEDEAAQLLEQGGVRLGVDEVTEMVRRTEGWPGGLHLAALALADGDRPVGDWVFSDHQRLVGDYLVEEVLETQSREMVRFLETSALLDTMSASLLDQVLDRTDSGRMLDGIERSGNLFLVPLDDEREWYRYHALFGGMLRSRLRRRDPELARRVDSRASEALESRGDIDGALRHALAAGDTGRGADLVLAQAFGLVNVGRVALLGQWLDLIEMEAMEHHAAAAIAWAWYGLGTSDPDLFNRAVKAATAQSGVSGPMADGSPSVEAALATLRAIAAGRGINGVISDTQIVRDAGDAATNPWWGLATVLQGTALAMLGENDDARRCYVEAMAVLGDAPGTEATVLVHLAVLALRDDDLAEADGLADRALSIMERYNLKGVLPTLPVFPVSALVAARCGRVEESRSHRAAALEVVAKLGYISPRSGLYAHLLLAEAAIAVGDRSQARDSATEAERARRLDGSAIYLNEQLDELREQLAGKHDTSAMVTPLTSAEFRVLRYLPTHLSLQEVADELHISRHTAKSHSVSIYRKLGVSSRSEAVTEARRLGIMPT